MCVVNALRGPSRWMERSRILRPRANPDLDSRTPIFKTDPVLIGYQSAIRGYGTSKVGL